MHLISLMPGTVSAQLLDDSLQIHALTDLPQSENDLQLCEERVVALFQLQPID